MWEQMSDTHFCAILDIAGTEKLLGPPEKLAKKLLAHCPHSRHPRHRRRQRQHRRSPLPLARNLASFRSPPSSPPAKKPKSCAPSPALRPLPHPRTRRNLRPLGHRHPRRPRRAAGKRIDRPPRPGRPPPASTRPTARPRTSSSPPTRPSPSKSASNSTLPSNSSTRSSSSSASSSITSSPAPPRKFSPSPPSPSRSRSKAAATHTRTVRPALPDNDRRLWLRLLHLDLQAHPPSAAILSVTLTADPGATQQSPARPLLPAAPRARRLDVTLARIRSFVGEQRIGRAVLEDTHRPDAFRMEPFAIPTTTTDITVPNPASAGPLRASPPPPPRTHHRHPPPAPPHKLRLPQPALHCRARLGPLVFLRQLVGRRMLVHRKMGPRRPHRLGLHNQLLHRSQSHAPRSHRRLVPRGAL